MGTSQHLSTLEVITSRHHLLDQIHTGTQNRRDILENLDASRSTIDRAVRELEEENVIHRRGGRIEFTFFGLLAYQEFCEVSKTLKTLSDADRLLSILPEDSELSIEFLDGAEVWVANQRAPVDPFKRFTPAQNSNRIQAMLPVLFPQQLNVLCQRAESGSPIRLLIHVELTDILEENYPDEFETLANGPVEISTSTNLPQFGLIISGSDTLWVSIHRDNGWLRGLIENQRREAISEAQRVFERYLEESDKWKIPEHNPQN